MPSDRAFKMTREMAKAPLDEAQSTDALRNASCDSDIDRRRDYNPRKWVKATGLASYVKLL
mgnify:CR=1 FL=1